MTLKRRFNIENLPCEKRDLEWFVWADPCSGSSKAGSEDEADWVVWCSMGFIIREDEETFMVCHSTNTVSDREWTKIPKAMLIKRIKIAKMSD